MNTIRLGIVDDDRLIVSLLSSYFEQAPLIELVVQESIPATFLEKLRSLSTPPDIVLIDLQMEELDGIDLLKVLRSEFPAIKGIIMSSHYKKSFTGFLFKTGAAAFISKSHAPETLVKIIKEVHTNGFYFLPEQVESMRSQMASQLKRPSTNAVTFTRREREIILFLCQQKTADEIGEKLFISRRTVEGHKNNIFAKTGAKNLAGVVIYAVKNGLVNPEELVI